MPAQQSFLLRGRAMKSCHWPDGRRAAVSLSFDDARLSQIDTGLALFRKLDVRVTFFVKSANIQERLAGWKQAVADGHEIGNHTVTHPCSGNYLFSLKNALEDYDLRKMAEQLDDAKAQFRRRSGVAPRTFACP